jgi:hypothetical protein
MIQDLKMQASKNAGDRVYAGDGGDTKLLDVQQDGSACSRVTAPPGRRSRLVRSTTRLGTVVGCLVETFGLWRTSYCNGIMDHGRAPPTGRAHPLVGRDARARTTSPRCAGRRCPSTISRELTTRRAAPRRAAPRARARWSARRRRRDPTSEGRRRCRVQSTGRTHSARFSRRHRTCEASHLLFRTLRGRP